MKLYIYDIETSKHIATVTGCNNQDCESKAASNYDSNDYGWTYSPAFGSIDGLSENAEAIAI